MQKSCGYSNSIHIPERPCRFITSQIGPWPDGFTHSQISPWLNLDAQLHKLALGLILHKLALRLIIS